MSSLWALIGKRIALGILTLFLVSVIIFGSIELLPGDIASAILGQAATPETLAAFREELGLEQPAVQRYFAWLFDILQGDLGRSLANGKEISEIIANRLGNTVFLALFAAAIAIPLAVTLGMIAALFRNSIFDRMINVSALSAVSFPEFFLAYVLILVLAQSGLFPSLSRIDPGMPFIDRLHATFLPAMTLTLVITAHMMRMTRAAIVNLLASPYIEMAYLKGIPAWRVIFQHALPNALSPIINVIAINLAYLITGVVVVEVVFVYPGLGQLMVDSVSKRDVTVVQSVSLLFAAVYVLLNLTADVLSTLVNPRLRRKR
ncbi:MAG: ABC transporter permease [Roseovarius sp.]